MRILYISPYPPVRDGIGDYTAALAGAVSAQGHDVRVVAARSADGRLADEAIAVVPVNPRRVSGALEAIRAFDPDLVHVQFAVAAYGARVPGLVALLRGLRGGRAPVVSTLHEVTRDVESLRGAGRALYRAVARSADRVLVHNERSAAALKALAPEASVTVVPHPRAELPAPTTTAPELRERLGLTGARVLMAFGFVHVDKGLDVLVDALHRLRSRGHTDVRLVVAGAVRPRHGVFKLLGWRDDLHLRAVHRFVDRHGLRDAVTFTGYVPGGEIAPMLQMADVVVLPYRRIEDSGVANLALAAGAPMVVSDAGALPDYVPDPRRRVPPGEVEPLVAALEDVLSNDGQGQAPAVPAATAGVDFATVLERTLAIYGELAGA